MHGHGVGVGVQSALVGFWRTEIEFSAEFGGEDVCVSLQVEAFLYFTGSLEIFPGSLAFITRETQLCGFKTEDSWQELSGLLAVAMNKFSWHLGYTHPRFDQPQMLRSFLLAQFLHTDIIGRVSLVGTGNIQENVHLTGAHLA